MLGLAEEAIDRRCLSLPLAGAVTGHAAAVQLHQVSADRQTEAELAMGACRAAVGLAEAFKYKREKRAIDAAACIRDVDAHFGGAHLHSHFDLSSAGREFH